MRTRISGSVVVFTVATLFLIGAITLSLLTLLSNDAKELTNSSSSDSGVTTEVNAWLDGPDVILGFTDIDTSRGTEPQTLLENSQLVVVASVQEAVVVDRPREVSPEAIPTPDPFEPTPWPHSDPKSGPPTGVITHGFYTTRYTLQVQEVINSKDLNPPESLQVLTMGATIDGRELAYEDLPIYRVGERYLLFLRNNPSRRPTGDYSVASAAYGAYLLRDGSVYRPLGAENGWVAFEDSDGRAIAEGPFLQGLRNLAVAATP
jgi:hypothetical protein